MEHSISALAYAEMRMNNLKEVAEKELLVVEGDSNVADLQGFCAGVDVVKLSLQKNCLPYVYDIEAQSMVEQLDAAIVLSMDNDIATIQGSPEWQDYKDDIKKAVDEKKNFLYNEAKKGRDLAFIQGWKKAVSYIDSVFEKIQERAEDLRKAPTLF